MDSRSSIFRRNKQTVPQPQAGRAKYNQFSDETLANIVDISMTMNSDEMRRYIDDSAMAPAAADSMLTQNLTLFGGTVAADINSDSLDMASAKQHADSLYSRFLENLRCRTNDSEIFDTIKDLIESCSDTLYEISKPTASAARMGSTTATTKSVYKWLTKERETWRLLYALYKDRLVVQKEAEIDGGGGGDDIQLLTGSEREIIEHLYVNNANLREYQLIVDWLEQTAADEHDQIKEGGKIGFYTDRTIGWENTLLELKKVNQSFFNGGGGGGGRRAVDLVTSLDPDAPHREQRRLADLDAEDQTILARQVLMEIRKGHFDDAQSLYEHCGHPWQAAVLEGWRLHHDPNFETIIETVAADATTTKTPIEGNPRRDLWKKLAWQTADRPTLDETNRAIVGILCGHLDAAMRPMSHSWSDLLWVYLKVQIDIRVESEIRSTSTKSYLEMPDRYWNGKMSLEQIFEELAAHSEADVYAAARNPVNVIQKYLILDDIPEMMKHIDQWIGEGNGLIDGQMLRFLTHIVLFMRQVGRHHQEDIADRVIKTYVECLIGLGDRQLVAFYTAAVPPDMQTLLYSRFLQTIDADTIERRLALEEAATVGLDVHTITVYTVEAIRTDDDNSNSAAVAAETNRQLEGTINGVDLRKISALEWLTFYPGQKAELLWQTNAMIRTFLAEGKVECVRQTMRQVPTDSVTQIIQNCGGNRDEVPHRAECSIKEYLCYQVYLAALDGYNDWARVWHSRPKQPEQVAANANFTERIAGEHKANAFKVEMERWNMGLMEQTKG